MNNGVKVAAAQAMLALADTLTATIVGAGSDHDNEISPPQISFSDLPRCANRPHPAHSQEVEMCCGKENGWFHPGLNQFSQLSATSTRATAPATIKRVLRSLSK